MRNTGSLNEIGKKLNIDHATVLYAIKKYADDVRYCPKFKELVKRIDLIINRQTKIEFE
jgi:chromosomal replication initiation ATPase DnaA